MFKFIHAADLHLDSPLRGLAQYEGAPQEALRGATRRALENLVHVALEEEVDFVLIAGDVYDGDWLDHNTGLFFTRQMARLRDAKIPVYLISGNHDAQSVVTKSLQLPDNIHRFPTKKAATMHLEDIGVAIHGQGFATRAVTVDLSANYPIAVPGVYNIGLLHTSLTGYEGHDNYAPCTVEGLRKPGYDYWALGHIHKQEAVRVFDPAIWFPGNIQGRHIRETGPKGCLVVSVDDSGNHEVDFRELDVVRWAEIAVDASRCATLDECVDDFKDALLKAIDTAGERLLAVRPIFTGASKAHGELLARPKRLLGEIRNIANIHGGDQVWIEKVKVRTTVPKSAGEPLDEGPLAELAHVIAFMKTDEASLAELAALLEPLHGKLPVELAEGESALGLDQPQRLVEWLDESEALLRAVGQRLEMGE
ncbi:MAG: DNA repair exonuclease [Candidatus Hydrogenedentes bacterium]|nr:DNA repair exonuclease [Candidatus Hydrogenedentota bacterium]